MQVFRISEQDPTLGEPQMPVTQPESSVDSRIRRAEDQLLILARQVRDNDIAVAALREHVHTWVEAQTRQLNQALVDQGVKLALMDAAIKAQDEAHQAGLKALEAQYTQREQLLTAQFTAARSLLDIRIAAIENTWYRRLWRWVKAKFGE